MTHALTIIGIVYVCLAFPASLLILGLCHVSARADRYAQEMSESARRRGRAA